MASFGANVRSLRGGMSRRELARRIGVQEGSAVVPDIEADRHDPKLSKVLRIAKALGVTVDALLDGIDPDYDAMKRQTLVGVGRDSPQTKQKELPLVTLPEKVRHLEAELATLRAALAVARDHARACANVADAAITSDPHQTRKTAPRKAAGSTHD